MLLLMLKLMIVDASAWLSGIKLAATNLVDAAARSTGSVVRLLTGREPAPHDR